MRKIKNTTGAGLGTYIGSNKDAAGMAIEREHIFFPGAVVTELDEKKLAEAVKDPIVKGWFDDGSLVDQTVSDVVAKAAAEPKKDDAKK